MTIEINTIGYPLPVSKEFIQMLTQQFKDTDIPKEINRITVKFTDPKYGQKPGGFHPTDVQLENKVEGWCVVTVCDYCNVSHTQYPHFAKDLEFDFVNKLYHNIGSVFSPERALEDYKLWQTNFVFFVKECSVYDSEIEFYWTPNIR